MPESPLTKSRSDCLSKHYLEHLPRETANLGNSSLSIILNCCHNCLKQKKMVPNSCEGRHSALLYVRTAPNPTYGSRIARLRRYWYRWLHSRSASEAAGFRYGTGNMMKRRPLSN